MLVTRKINVFSFFFGKPSAANNAIARSESKAQNLNDTNIAGLDRKINITKSEDLYKAHSVAMINPFSQLNR